MLVNSCFAFRVFRVFRGSSVLRFENRIPCAGELNSTEVPGGYNRRMDVEESSRAWPAFRGSCMAAIGTFAALFAIVACIAVPEARLLLASCIGAYLICQIVPLPKW